MKKISAVIVMCSIGLAVHAQLIDDFSGDLSAYTLTKVLDQGDGTSNVGFDISGGQLHVFSTGTSGPEQVLFLRDDVSLGIGNMLLADISHTGDGWDRDIGIAVSYSATPTGLGNPEAGDVRHSYVEVSFRSNNQVVSYANDGGTSLASGQVFPGIVDVLYLGRTSATDFEVGYINGGVATPIQTYTINTDTPGAAVGFYADLRADLASSPVGLDNFRMDLLPEPSALALAGLGIAGLLIARRRR